MRNFYVKLSLDRFQFALKVGATETDKQQSPSDQGRLVALRYDGSAAVISKSYLRG